MVKGVTSILLVALAASANIACAAYIGRAHRAQVWINPHDENCGLFDGNGDDTHSDKDHMVITFSGMIHTHSNTTLIDLVLGLLTIDNTCSRKPKSSVSG